MRRPQRSLTTWSVALASWAAVWMATPGAQSAPQAPTSADKANWLTDGGDNQRTAWQRNETRITTDSVKNMKLLWKVQLDNQPRQMHNLFPALIVTDVTTVSRDRRRLPSLPVCPTTSTASTSPLARGCGRGSSTARSSSSRAAVAAAFSVRAGRPRRR